MVKVSIIVPVYNVQAYLGKCMESLMAQTLKDIEIICINDGSTDDSLAILEYFARQDKRIKIIDKENGGVSSARNAGLEAAQGEYVMFVDGDDWIEPDTCEECYDKIVADKADLLIFDYYEYTERIGLTNTSNHLTCFTKTHFSFSDCPTDFFYVLTSVWGKFFKNNNLLLFEENLKKGEDTVFFWRFCICNNPVITIFPFHFYYYYLRQNSAMHQKKYVQSSEIINSAESLVSTEEYKNLSTFYKACILDRFAQSLWWEIEHSHVKLDRQYIRKVSSFLQKIKELVEIKRMRFAPKLQKSLFNEQHKLLSKILNIILSYVGIEYRLRHKVIHIFGIKLKLKYIGGRIAAEQYYINQIRKNYKKYPKDTYLLFDCLHDEKAEAIDAYSLFEKMREKNIQAYYVVRKQTSLYQKLEKENKLENVIVLNFSTRNHPNEFMQKIYEILLRTKCILTSFGENSAAVQRFFREQPSWKYIFLQHGPTFMKESVLYNGYLYPAKFDKFLICSDHEERIWLKYNFSNVKLIKVGLPRWDLLKYAQKSQKRSILLMFTWRQLKAQDFDKSLYKENLLRLLHNKKLIGYLKKRKISIYFAPHHALSKNAHINFDLSGEKNIQLIQGNEISQYIRKCSCLLTDFSSVAFDFMFQYKPVIFYLLDKKDAQLGRMDKDDIAKFNYKKYILPDVYFDEDSVVDRIIEYCENNFKIDERTRKIYDSFFYTKENIREKLIEKLEKICPTQQNGKSA